MSLESAMGHGGSTARLFGQDRQQCEDAPYIDCLADIQFQPVFIIGQHRSGTSILYELLSATDLFNVTSFYHIVNQSRLLHLHFQGKERWAKEELARTLDSRGVRTRGYDLMTVTPDSGHEYAWALEHQGRRPTLRASNMESFVRFCRKLQLIQHTVRPLLLKNPFDIVNFLYLHKMFPRAQFVFIHRNTVEMASSQIKAIRSVLSEKNEYEALFTKRYEQLFRNPWKVTLARWIYSDRFPILFLQVTRNIAAACDYVLENFTHLGDRAMGLSYPELCADPNSCIRRILRFLGLKDCLAFDCTDMISPRSVELEPEVARRRRAIEKRTIAYCQRFGV